MERSEFSSLLSMEVSCKEIKEEEIDFSKLEMKCEIFNFDLSIYFPVYCYICILFSIVVHCIGMGLVLDYVRGFSPWWDPL